MLTKYALNFTLSTSRHALLLFIGVACLELFIQLNWTGPSDPQHRIGILPGCNQEASNQIILQRLREDGQVANYR